MLKVPALLKQQVQTVRFQTVRLLYVLQLFFVSLRHLHTYLQHKISLACRNRYIPGSHKRLEISTSYNIIKKLFSVYSNTMAFLLESLKHCNAITFVIVYESAVPVFQSCEECVSAVLFIRFFVRNET